MLVEASRVKEYQMITPEEQLQDYFGGLREKVASGFDEATETTIYTYDGRKISISVLDPKKVFEQPQAMMIEAHPDDATLAGGIANVSADIGMGVSYVTLTDGSARELDGFADRKELARTRLQESVEAARVAGGALVINLGYPDAELPAHRKSAAREVAAIMEILNPEYAIATNPNDAHGDHEAGYKIAKLARRKTKTSLYATDTQNGATKRGLRTRLSHYIPINADTKRVRDDSFAAHASQQPGSIPTQDEVHVAQVYAMPQRHGERVGADYAIGLRKKRFSKDTLRARMEANGIDVIRPNSPKVIYERVKAKLLKVA